MGKVLEKNPVRISSKFFLTALFVLFFVTSCNNNLITPLDGSLVINLPSARSVSENVKEYKVDISGSQGEKQSQTAKVGGSIVFNDVAPDTYTITVEGLDENSKVILRGEGTTTVEPGKSASVTIELKVVGVLITFDDGTGKQYEKEVVYGEKLPANEFREEGKDFIHWTTEKDGTGTEYQDGAISDFTEPTTLYAHWGISHKVTFYANYDGADPETTTQTVEDDVETALTKNTFVREGYTFTGWDENSDGNSGTRYNDEGKITTSTDLKLYAQWKANTYTVVYNGNGGQTADGSKTVEDSQTFTYDVQGTLTQNSFTREGYTFAGWTKDVADTGEKVTSANNLTSVAGGTVNLYAQWTANKYTVTFHANYDGASTENPTQGFTYGTEGTLNENTFVREDYTFVGWHTEADGGEAGTLYTNKQSVNNLTSEPNGTVNLYAQWAANTYTVTFNSNTGGTGTMEPKTLNYGDSLPKNLFEATDSTNYVFAGWTEEQDGSGKLYDDESMATFFGDTTLYAQWAVTTFSALKSAASQGGVVYIGEDIGDATYAVGVTSQISVSNTLELRAARKNIRIAPRYDYSSSFFRIQENGSLTIGGGEYSLTFDACTWMSAVEMAAGSTFTLKENGIIEAATYAVKIGSSTSTFILDGGTITGCTASGRKGAVYITNGEFIMNSGSIINSEYTGSYNGAVYITGGTFTMNGGSISENKVPSDSGAAIYIEGGSVTMNDGEISNNTAGFKGGAIYISSGSFTMNGGKIRENTASNGDGGGVYMRGGSFTYEAGTISANTAQNGTGVYVASGATFNNNGNLADSEIYRE